MEMHSNVDGVDHILPAKRLDGLIMYTILSADENK